MKIALDKNSINCKKREDAEYIYIFDKETYEELKQINLHCVRYGYIDFVDINLTGYDIDCIKKASPKDKDFDVIPPKRDYSFAIIVPNYNNDHGDYKGKTFLQNCIESVLNQTYKDFNLIIIDDLSDDTSVETINKYKDKRIHLIKNTRKRYNGGSRNAGIEYALQNLEFDYFCFLDSDDWWKDDEVLEFINNKLYNHELMTLGCEQLFPEGIRATTFNEALTYEDLWSLDARVWCTAWARVIRKDKIKFFCEDTLMEDRVWTYKIADNISFNNVINSRRICYTWNRMNTTNSVSQVRNYFWEASAWCHIGHQLQFIETMKHQEMKPYISSRIRNCINWCNNGVYQQL